MAPAKGKYLAWAFVALLGCERAEQDLFVDVAAQAGVDFLHTTGASGARHLAETVSGGAAWIDYDGDGFFDLYCVNGNEHPDTGGIGTASNRLYRNEAGRRFRDVTAETGAGDRGYGIGAAVGDYDNDGRSDLYVTNFTLSDAGGNVLYRNESGRRFSDVTAKARTAPGGFSTSAAFLDFDGDGSLDLYVARYVRYDPSHHCDRGGISSHCGPNDYPGEPDVLYRNLGDGTFEDASVRSGIAFEDPAGGAGLGVVALDFDDDGDTDVFVANDQSPNYLFRNDGGRFTDVALAAGVAYGPDGNARAGMGVDAGDVDLDGREDLVVTHFADEPDGLFLAEGGGQFHDAAAAMGLARPTLLPLGFGAALLDYDLDGDLDLYVAEGHVQDNIHLLRPGSGQTFAQPDLLLENDRGRGFTDVSARAGAWFRAARVGRAVASADFDEDGDEDLLVVNSAGPVALLENRSARRGGWVGLRLRGTRSNRDGYGARVAVLITGKDGLERSRFFEVRSGRSYAAACDPRVRVGLGPEPPRSIRAIVRWPGPGHGVEEYPGILPGRVTELVESAEAAARLPAAFPSAPGRAAAAMPEPSAASAASASSAASTASPAPGTSPASTAPAAPASAADARRITDLLRPARELRAGHRLAEALAALQEACATDASLASSREARFLEAELCFSLYRTADSVHLLESLCQEDPSASAPRIILARALVDLGRHREAVKLFQALLAGGNEIGGEGRRACARALVESGRSEEAVGQLAAALAADPWLDAAYLDYGEALHRLGGSDRAGPFLARYRLGEEARRLERAAINLENQGRPAQAQHLRGRAEVLRGRAFGAMTFFNRALSLNPKDGAPLLALALLSARLERPAEALKRLTPFANDPAVAAVLSEIEKLGTVPPEKSTDQETDLDRTRRSIRERMAGRPLSASIGELLELARALAAAGEAARSREVALFAAEIAPREAAAQLAAAEIFQDPGEAFIRLWALDRAIRLSPGDEALRSRRAALARELAVAEAMGGRSGRP